MPIVNITMGQVNEETKLEIIARTTETLMDITGLGADHFTTLIHELPYENIGKGKESIKQIIAKAQNA